MRKMLVALVAVTGAGLLVPVSSAAAAEPTLPKNPVKACQALAQLDPEAYEFLSTQPGACVSSIASVGVEALMAGAFPSNAAAVGNCKAIEKDVGGYPYQFYGFLPGLAEDFYQAGLIDEATRDEILELYAGRADMLLGKNRADCLRLLRYFHGGGMDDIYALMPPEFFED